MEENKMSRYIQLRNEIEGLPGYHAILENHRLNNSIYIFDQNFSELMELINFMEQDPRAMDLLSMSGRKQLSSVDRELLRRLHNFVASAKSLIDHTRRIYNKYYRKSSRFPEYSEAINAHFVNDPLSRFVQQLREYAQHYRSPALVYVTHFDNATKEETRSVALQVDDLTTFDRWESIAKEYIESAEDNIPIRNVVTTYRNKVIQFYDWFQRKQHDIHEVEIQEYKAKETEMILIQLEVQLNIIIANPDEPHHHPDEPLEYILSDEDLQKLRDRPLDSPDRADFAIHLLQTYIPVPESIKEQMRLVHQRYGTSENREPA